MSSPKSNMKENKIQKEGMMLKESPASQDNPMRILKFAYFCIFADFLGLSVCLPLLPFYATELGATHLMVGAVLSLFSIGQLIGNVILGYLSDRFGRRPVIIASLFGSCLMYIAHDLTSDLLVLLELRFVTGVVCGAMPVCQAMIMDTVSDPTEQSKYMSYCYRTIGAAFILGPVIGTVCSQFISFQSAFLCAAILPFMFGIFAVAKLEETKPKEEPSHQLDLAVMDKKAGFQVEDQVSVQV